MTPINPTQLNVACQTASLGSALYSGFLNDSLKVFYSTGCRPVELTDKSRWAVVSPSVVSLMPAKGNNLRLINSLLLPNSFMKWIKDESSPFGLVTYSKSKNLLSKCWPIPQCYVLDKSLDLYAFRHNYVKQLHAGGMTSAQIQAAMGWTNGSMVNVYVNSIVYYL